MFDYSHQLSRSHPLSQATALMLAIAARIVDTTMSRTANGSFDT